MLSCNAPPVMVPVCLQDEGAGAAVELPLMRSMAT